MRATTTRGRTAVAITMMAVGVIALVAPPVGADEAATARTPGDRCFIGVTHGTFLDRPATLAELAYWETQFGRGVPRSDLPDALANSDEWLTVVVDGLYRQALDRPADDAGRTYWIGELRRGALVNRVASLIYGSAEFYTRAGGTTDGYIRQLYTRILHRPADTAGLTYWRGQVATRGRGTVAAAFFASVESRGDRVDTLYDQILGRPSDASGRAFWIERLATVNDVRLAVLLASSGEAFTRAERICATFTGLSTMGTATSFEPSISDDGSIVAFRSASPNLVPGDTNDSTDIFVWDRSTGTMIRIGDGNSSSFEPSVSADGRHVAFRSSATNLVPGATGWANIYSLDRSTGSITLVSNGNQSSRSPAASADGRFIAYESDASNLVAGDTNGQRDVFVWSRSSGTTTRLTDGNGRSGLPDISGDGRFIAFESDATDLAPFDTNGATDVFLIDRSLRTTTLVTYGDGASREPVVAADGSHVAFTTAATDLSPTDGDTVLDVYTWRRATATTTRVSVGNPARTGESGFPDISADGRYITFSSLSGGLIPGQANSQRNVFIWDREAARVTRRITDGNTFSRQPVISADGRHVAFESLASNLVTGDTNGEYDIFVWDDLREGS